MEIESPMSSTRGSPGASCTSASTGLGAVCCAKAHGRHIKIDRMDAFINLLLRGLRDNSGPIAEHFGDALHHLGSIITDSDDRIGAELPGVLEHQVERRGPG